MPIAEPGAPGPPSWRSNGPATRPAAPSGPSTQCEPENRLVARSLEARWEARLAALAEAEKALASRDRATAPPLPDTRRTRSRSPPTSPRCGTRRPPPPRDRKRLLRTLIADVTLLAEPDFAKTRIGIRWHTGATDELVVARRQAGHRVPTHRTRGHRAGPSPRRPVQHTTSPSASTPPDIITGAGRPFDRMAVANLRHYHHVPQPELLEDGEITVADIARRARHHPRCSHPLDRPRMAIRPARPQRPVVRPFRSRRRSRLPRAGGPISPHPYTRHDRPEGRPRAHRRRGRCRPRHQHQRRLLLDRTPPHQPPVRRSCSSFADSRRMRRIARHRQLRPRASGDPYQHSPWALRAKLTFRYSGRGSARSACTGYPERCDTGRRMPDGERCRRAVCGRTARTVR